MASYTESNPHVIKTEISAPMEYSFDKCVGVLGGEWNQEKCFTPRWLAPATTEESIEPVWKTAGRGIKNHLGVAVTARGEDESGKKTDWVQILIIDAGYLWDNESSKSGEPTKMVFQVRCGNYNARVIFEKSTAAKTKMSYIEWGTRKGLGAEDVSDPAKVDKFASEVAKQFSKEAAGKDRRNLKKITQDTDKKILKIEMLTGFYAARARKITANEMLKQRNGK